MTREQEYQQGLRNGTVWLLKSCREWHLCLFLNQSSFSHPVIEFNIVFFNLGKINKVQHHKLCSPSQGQG